MALDTYSGLKAEIGDYLDRDDLSTQIESFIRLAEARHRRQIRIREMIARAQTPTAERFLSLPDGFLEMKTIRLLTSPITVLAEVNLHEMNRLRKEEPRTPRHFTVHEEIEFDTVPASSLTSEMIYFAQLTPLSDANPSNALLTRAPDAYLYGALLAAEPFLVNDERVQVWSALYVAAADGLNALDRKRAGPLVSRVSGATP